MRKWKEPEYEHCRPLNFQHAGLGWLHPHTAALTKDAISTDDVDIKTANDQNISSNIANFVIFLHLLNFYKSYPFYEENVICILEKQALRDRTEGMITNHLLSLPSLARDDKLRTHRSQQFWTKLR